MNAEQVEKIFLTAAIGRLLGWCSATLATVGVTVNFGEGSAAQIATVVVGVLGMWGHYLLSKYNLRKAMQSPPPLPPKPQA